MGDAQSAQREDKKDAAAEEESGKVDDAQQNTEDKPLTNNGLISEINGKADGSLEEVNGHCEDEIAAEAILSPDEDVSETEKPLKEEETPLKDVEINKKESPNEADVNEDVPLEMIEMDAKQNDINESFRRFFGNIGLKLTVKRGSGEIATDVPDESHKEEPNRPEDAEDNAKETTSENAEHTDVNIAQETYDNDSTTCPTLTDITSEDVLENAEEKTTETKEKVESDNADAATTLPVAENAHQDATSEKEPHSTSVYSPDEEVVDSPIKRFFTTGIFSGLRKKKKPAEVETTDKELKDMTKKEVMETAEPSVQDQDKEEISLGVEAAAVETEIELKGEILAAESDRKTDASTIDPSTIIVSEPEILNSQEKDKVQASPLKKLLSGSSFKKLSKKQRGRKSSDARLSDSGEHVSDQLLSSNESAENQKEECCAQPSAEAPGEEESAWVSFKKLLTPKKRMKRPSLGNEETQIPGSVEEPKPSEEGQISDHSTEESKKRKDSSVSWEAVLCGSGRRRSRKTSDSEDETPQIDNDTNKQDGGSKNGAESALESSNEADEIIAYSPKRAGSPSEGDGGSTWKSLKRLVTPKRKARDEDESKDNVHSDSEITQDESSFSIKKLLPGRKKRKSVEKQDQVSSDEADKDVASGDEDSETPAVVPLSEFDTVETEVHIQTKADVESHIPKEADYELHQDLLDQKAEPVLPGDSLQTETKKAQDNEDALENKASITATVKEEPDDSTESISKQQLSDIPEEATPASFTEEAARDDTIAEDLIEITSEAITAPEPLDTTMADETEMISAVSQLSSESSKTSGNTTPVPAEYDVQETDALLHKVAETISISPKAVRACSDELQSERIIVSDSPQILETFVKEEQTILEVHRRLDTTDINAGQNVEELDANNELASTTQTESNDSVSTEIISEVPTEEFDTAEIAADEVHELDVTQPEESLKELESIDESHNLVECLSEVNAAVCTDILPEGDQIVPADGSSAEAHQTETEAPKMDSQEVDSAATVVDETKDGPVEQEVKSLTEKEAQIMDHITDQTRVEDKHQPSIEVAIQAATLHSEEGSVQLLEKDVMSADIPTVAPTEVNVEPEKEDKQETDADKPVCAQVPEASEAVQTSTLDSETVTEETKQTTECITKVSVEPENKELPVNVQETKVLTVQEPTLDSAESSVQSIEKEAISEDVPEAETVTDEPKEEIKPLTEDNLEPVNTTKTEQAQESEVIETVKIPLLNSEEGSVQSLEKEAISEDVPEAETVTAEPKEEIKPLTEDNLEPVDTTKTEVTETVQAPLINSEEGSIQSLEKEAISEDIREAETVTHEPKEETIPPTEVSMEPVDSSKTGRVLEPEVLEATQAASLDSVEGSVQPLEKQAISEDIPEAETVTVERKEETKPLTEDNLEPVGTTKTEHAQESEVIETVQASVLDSEEGSVQSLEKEAISEDVPEAETVTDEPKEETKPLTEDDLEPLDTSKTEHAQKPEVLQTVQASSLDSVEGSVQSLEKEVISEDVSEAETVTDEPKEETIPPTEVSFEPADSSKTEHVQEPEVLEAAQATSLDSVDGSVQSREKEAISEDVPEAETVTDEPKEETQSLTEDNLEPLDTSKTEHAQKSEVIETIKAPFLDSESSVQSLEKEVISEDVPEAEAVTDEPKGETIPSTEVNFEPADSSKTRHVHETEVLQTVHEPTLDSEAGSLLSLDKKVLSEDIPEVETAAEEPKQETGGKPEEQQPVEAFKTEHVQEQEVLEAVQAPTSDLEKGSIQSLEKEVISEDVPEVETVTDEDGKETTPPTEVNLEPVDASKDISVAETVTEEPKQETDVKPEEQRPVEASKNEHVQEVLEAVQAPTSDLEGIVQSRKKEEISEGVPETETVTVTDEAAKETIPPTEINLEPVDTFKDIPPVETVTEEPKQGTEVEQEEQQPVEASKNENVQEVLEAVQAPTSDLEEGIVQSREKEEISEGVPETETVTDEARKDTMPSTEVNLEPVDTSKDIPAVETVTEEPKQGTEVEQEKNLPVEAAKAEHVQETVVLLSGLKDIVTGTKTDEGTSTYDHVVTDSLQGGSAQQISLEDILKPEVDTVITSVEDRIEKEVVAQLDQSLEITEDQKTERIPQVGIEQEGRIPDVVDKLQALTAVCVSCVNDEASIVHVLEQPVLTEKNPVPCVDHVEVTNEPEHEVHLSAVQASVEVEKESELPGKEIKTAVVEHAVVAQVVTCNLKDIAAAIPDALIEKTSAITEPLIDRVASEQVFKEEVETATPLVKADVVETAEASSVVVTHVPSVEFEDNHRIQVQGMDVNIKSAETTVDTVLEAGITEDKEVIDVCHETIKKVDNLSATAEIEDKLINDENKLIIQEVIQHVKENIPETKPESVVVNLEQEGIKQTDAVTEVSDVIEKESIEVEGQNVMEDNTTTFKEKQDEAPAVISDVSATEQQVSEDLKETPDIPRSSDISSHDLKEDLEETKNGHVKSEAVVTAEDLDVKKMKEEVQLPPVAQSPTVTPSNTGIVATQNTGIISSIGNVETPSSLSFEFKFNIQFEQAKASPPSTTEKTEPVKKTDVSEVGVQAVEAEEPIRPTQRAESQKQAELSEVTDKATEITEPAAKLDSTEIAVITTQPALLDVGIQDMEIVESVEEIKSTERATSSVQASEIIQPVRPTENREVILSQPVLSQCCDQETKAEEPVKQKEEENDQDVWMDAEEDIYTQEEKELSHHEVKESLEPQAERVQEEKAGLEREVEMVANSKPKEEESQPDSQTAVTCENDSDGEDFAVALEDLEIATASVRTME